MADPAGAARRTHHIAAIAHHFLPDQGEAAARVDWVVAASGPWPWTVPAALELARLQARDAGAVVVLAEDAGVAWSVRSRVGDGDDAVRVVAADSAAAHGGGPLCWHLGDVGDGRLADLAAVRRAPGGRLPGDGRPRRLLWCLAHREAGSDLPGLAPLVALLDPVAVDVVCMPAHGGRRAGTDASAPPPDPAACRAVADRAARVCGVPVAVHVLTRAMSGAARGAVLAAAHGRRIPLDPPATAP